MSDFRQAQNQAHPSKTNTLLSTFIGVMIVILSLQIWLLIASLGTTLGGDDSIALPAFLASLVLFVCGVAMLRYLPAPLRAPRRSGRD